jgi:hypothetical protein
MFSWWLGGFVPLWLIYHRAEGVIKIRVIRVAIMSLWFL